MTLETLVIVPARDEEERLPETLDRLRDIPGLDRLLVIDDGSRDATALLAKKAGAEVLRSNSSGTSSGKGRALLTGLRHAREYNPDAVLLADADLGESAARLSNLLQSLSEGSPVAIASFPRSAATGGGFGLVKSFARREISTRNSLGYVPAEPLSGQRALLVSALESLPGIAPGFGAEVGMTLDLLSAGITPQDVPIPLAHRPTGRSISGFAHRTRQGLDILKAIRGERLPW
jgi:glucosyl-3-phosphoglycerate synthase